MGQKRSSLVAMQLSHGYDKEEIACATKAQLKKRLDTLQSERMQVEEKLQEIEDEEDAIEDEIEERKIIFMEEAPVLQKLLSIVEKCGSWREMECVRAALDGDGLCKEDRQRLNILGIQFLNQKIL